MPDYPEVPHITSYLEKDPDEWQIVVSKRKVKKITYEAEYTFYWFEWMHVREFMFLHHNSEEIIRYLQDNYWDVEDFETDFDYHKKHERVISQIYQDIKDWD